VINVRGVIKAVVDLGRLLEIPPGGAAASGYVVMLRRSGGMIGLAVESVHEVRQIDAAHLTATHAESTALCGARFVKGITADNLILIDADAAVSGLGSDQTSTEENVS
jgi:chemotaxis signal transduction protein